MANDPTAKTGDGGAPNQVLLEENRARLREIFS
jgi:hypothetical protein